ncbi:hypothetical protein CHUAL_007835 [Chamberlinius hualienensis]
MDKVNSTDTLATTDTRDCCNYAHLKTRSGILKLFRLTIDLLGFICVMASGLYYLPRAVWFCFVSTTSFCLTVVNLFLNLFNCTQKKTKDFPWILTEIIISATFTVFYLIAAVLLAQYAMSEAFAAAIFFGYSSMITYGIDATLKSHKWIRRKLAQDVS